MIPILQYAVLMAASLCLMSLIYLVIRTFHFGKKVYFSKPQGNGYKGIIYAFTKGMMPWEKESAGHHILTFSAGILYHASILTALILLFAFLLRIKVPVFVTPIFKGILLIGFVCGLGLLIKRLIKKELNALSCPDDYMANLLVDLFLVLALASITRQAFIPYWFISAILLFLYIPLGKIRHCFFFFYSRTLLGYFFGRRGVFPTSPFQD